MKLKVHYAAWKAFTGKNTGRYTITVCTILNPETKQVTRGVSVCSEADSPLEGIGRFEAKCHALRALRGRGNRTITDRRAIKQILSTDCPFTKHVDMNPILTFQERRALFGYKNMLFDPRKEGSDAHWTVKHLDWKKMLNDIWKGA